MKKLGYPLFELFPRLDDFASTEDTELTSQLRVTTLALHNWLVVGRENGMTMNTREACATVACRALMPGRIQVGSLRPQKTSAETLASNTWHRRMLDSFAGRESKWREDEI